MLHIDNFNLTVLDANIITSNKTGKPVEYVKITLCDMDKSYQIAHVLTVFDTMNDSYKMLLNKLSTCKSAHPVIVCTGREYAYHSKFDFCEIKDVIDRVK